MRILRNFSAALALAAALTAVPAAADELRVEGRAGLLRAASNTEATIGVAGGYDMDMGPLAFVGGEISADKLLVSDASVYLGLSGRGGVRLGPLGRLFAVGGYTFAEGENMWHLGAGYERRIALALYWKAEYRHFMSDFANGDQLQVGLGLKF